MFRGVYQTIYCTDGNKCINNKWNGCEQKYINLCGDYHVHNLDASISFPSELTVEGYNRLNKCTKLHINQYTFIILNH